MKLSHSHLHPSTELPVHSPICPLTNARISLPTHPHTYLPIHPASHPPTHLSILPFTSPSIHHPPVSARVMPSHQTALLGVTACVHVCAHLCVWDMLATRSTTGRDVLGCVQPWGRDPERRLGEAGTRLI